MKKQSDLSLNNNHVKAAHLAALTLAGVVFMMCIPETAHANIISDVSSRKIKEISDGLVLAAQGLVGISLVCIIICFFFNKVNWKWAGSVIGGGAAVGMVSQLVSWLVTP